MPIYEYICPCGKKFERIKNFSRMREVEQCECGKEAKRVEISTSNFHLKGNWFKNRGKY